MSTVTGNLKTINADPTLVKLRIVALTKNWVVHGNLIYPGTDNTQLVTPDVNGFFAVRLVTGYYELWVGSNYVLILVPDDDLTYSFEELVVPSVDLPDPIVGGAVPSARSDLAGIVRTDDTVLQPVAATGWFYRGTAALARSSISNATNNKVLLVKGTGIFYEWDVASLGTDDGTETSYVITPAGSGPLDPGRWLAVTAGTVGGPPPGGGMIFGSGDPSGVVDAPMKSWFRDVPGKALYLNTTGGVNGWEPITG